MISIAIDGPSGAGKSTLAKELSRRLGYVYVDTGAMYRTIGLFIRQSGISPDDSRAVISALPSVNISVRYENGVQRMILNGNDVSDMIRTSEISSYASKVSAIPEVRTFLLALQRGFARTYNVIMDGRDIGTVILPDAQIKLFMSASDAERARRRWRELTEKGEDVSLEKVAASMAERDKNDSTRKTAPAVPAEDAVMLDNTGDFNETVEKALAIIDSKLIKL